MINPASTDSKKPRGQDVAVLYKYSNKSLNMRLDVEPKKTVTLYGVMGNQGSVYKSKSGGIVVLVTGSPLYAVID